MRITLKAFHEGNKAIYRAYIVRRLYLSLLLAFSNRIHLFWDNQKKIRIRYTGQTDGITDRWVGGPTNGWAGQPTDGRADRLRNPSHRNLGSRLKKRTAISQWTRKWKQEKCIIRTNLQNWTAVRVSKGEL